MPEFHPTGMEVEICGFLENFVESTQILEKCRHGDWIISTVGCRLTASIALRHPVSYDGRPWMRHCLPGPIIFSQGSFYTVDFSLLHCSRGRQGGGQRCLRDALVLSLILIWSNSKLESDLKG